MNRMIGFGDAFTSSITDFRRFSNSPLTPAPAWSRPRSSVRTETFLQRRRHVAVGDAQGESFDHGGLADAGLAGQDRDCSGGGASGCRRSAESRHRGPAPDRCVPAARRSVKSIVNWSSAGVDVDPAGPVTVATPSAADSVASSVLGRT